MSHKQNSVMKSVLVPLIILSTCILIISSVAIMLKPYQIANKTSNQEAEVLVAAGIDAKNHSIDEVFKENITVKIVNITTGEFADDVALQKYDTQKSLKVSDNSLELTKAQDIAKIKRIAKFKKVYLVKEGGVLKTLVLPIRGKAKSMLYGYITLDADCNTIQGLTFYSHAETPGLGGEVDNLEWRQSWKGKKIHDNEGVVLVGLVKGGVTNTTPNKEYKVDGLSGATLTSKGVTNLLQFWLGENGYQSFLNNIVSGDA